MKRLIIITGIMLLSVSALAFQFTGSGGGGKRYNVTVSQTQIKGPAWVSQGVYSSTATRQHAVTYAGSTWIALQNNTNQTPSDGSVYWAKYISKGDTGATGPQGPIGLVSGAAGVTSVQRLYSSGIIQIMQPSVNGDNYATITVPDNLVTKPVWKFGDTQITLNDNPYAGSGGSGSSSFSTVKRSVLTNMSSSRLYEPEGFAKHNLPTAAGSQTVRVFANATSAQVGVNTGAGVIKDFGGITSTAGYSVRVPKGSVYEFFSTTADSTWYAIKQAGSALTQYIQAFVAALTNSPSTTYTFPNTNIGSTAFKNISTANTGNATATSFTQSISGVASRFRVASTTCGNSLGQGASCYSTIAFDSMSTASKSAVFSTSATGIGPYNVTVSGTGLAVNAYLAQKNFEATLGSDTTQSWSPSMGTGASASLSDTTSPVGHGSQQLKIIAGSGGGTERLLIGSSSDTIDAHFMFRYDTAPASLAHIFDVGDESYVSQGFVGLNNSGTLQVTSGVVNQTTVGTLAANTWYHVWFHRTKSSGANDGAYSIAFSTDTTRPTSGNNYKAGTNGTNTSTISSVMLKGEKVTTAFFDQLLVSSTDVGAIP